MHFTDPRVSYWRVQSFVTTFEGVNNKLSQKQSFKCILEVCKYKTYMQNIPKNEKYLYRQCCRFMKKLREERFQIEFPSAFGRLLLAIKTSYVHVKGKEKFDNNEDNFFLITMGLKKVRRHKKRKTKNSTKSSDAKAAL